MSKGGRSMRVSEEALFTMSQKNEKEKVKFRKAMVAMNKEEKKSAENLDKALTGTKKELLELHAYRQVYERHRLRSGLTLHRSNTWSPRKSAPEVEKTVELPKVQTASSAGSSASSGDGGWTRVRRQLLNKDPFNLKKLMDVDMDDDVFVTQASKATHPPAEDDGGEGKTAKKRNVNRPLYGGLEYKTMVANTKRTSQIFPAHCRTHFSVKRYMEDEKNKLMDRFLPDGKKRHMLKKMAEKSRLPPLARSKTTSAIFRDFREARSKSFVAERRTRRYHSDGDVEDERTDEEREIVAKLRRPSDTTAARRKASTVNRMQLLNMAKSNLRMSTV